MASLIGRKCDEARVGYSVHYLSETLHTAQCEGFHGTLTPARRQADTLVRGLLFLQWKVRQVLQGYVGGRILLPSKGVVVPRGSSSSHTLSHNYYLISQVEPSPGGHMPTTAGHHGDIPDWSPKPHSHSKTHRLTSQPVRGF